MNQNNKIWSKVRKYFIENRVLFQHDNLASHNKLIGRNIFQIKNRVAEKHFQMNKEVIKITLKNY